ncbi:hypothetical protein KIPB_005862, partial [Kipferlia bialata]|eukprot:g5862.t1
MSQATTSHWRDFLLLADRLIDAEAEVCQSSLAATFGTSAETKEFWMEANALIPIAVHEIETLSRLIRDWHANALTHTSTPETETDLPGFRPLAFHIVACKLFSGILSFVETDLSDDVTGRVFSVVKAAVGDVMRFCGTYEAVSPPSDPAALPFYPGLSTPSIPVTQPYLSSQVLGVPTLLAQVAQHACPLFSLLCTRSNVNVNVSQYRFWALELFSGLLCNMHMPGQPRGASVPLVQRVSACLPLLSVLVGGVALSAHCQMAAELCTTHVLALLETLRNRPQLAVQPHALARVYGTGCADWAVAKVEGVVLAKFKTTDLELRGPVVLPCIAACLAPLVSGPVYMCELLRRALVAVVNASVKFLRVRKRKLSVAPAVAAGLFAATILSRSHTATGTEALTTLLGEVGQMVNAKTPTPLKQALCGVLAVVCATADSSGGEGERERDAALLEHVPPMLPFLLSDEPDLACLGVAACLRHLLRCHAEREREAERAGEAPTPFLLTVDTPVMAGVYLKAMGMSLAAPISCVATGTAPHEVIGLPGCYWTPAQVPSLAAASSGMSAGLWPPIDVALVTPHIEDPFVAAGLASLAHCRPLAAPGLTLLLEVCRSADIDLAYRSHALSAASACPDPGAVAMVCMDGLSLCVCDVSKRVTEAGMWLHGLEGILYDDGRLAGVCLDQRVDVSLLEALIAAYLFYQPSLVSAVSLLARCSGAAVTRDGLSLYESLLVAGGFGSSRASVVKLFSDTTKPTGVARLHRVFATVQTICHPPTLQHLAGLLAREQCFFGASGQAVSWRQYMGRAGTHDGQALRALVPGAIGASLVGDGAEAQAMLERSWALVPDVVNEPSRLYAVASNMQGRVALGILHRHVSTRLVQALTPPASIGYVASLASLFAGPVRQRPKMNTAFTASPDIWAECACVARGLRLVAPSTEEEATLYIETVDMLLRCLLTCDIIPPLCPAPCLSVPHLMALLDVCLSLSAALTASPGLLNPARWPRYNAILASLVTLADSLSGQDEQIALFCHSKRTRLGDTEGLKRPLVALLSRVRHEATRAVGVFISNVGEIGGIPLSLRADYQYPSLSDVFALVRLTPVPRLKDVVATYHQAGVENVATLAWSHVDSYPTLCGILGAGAAPLLLVLVSLLCKDAQVREAAQDGLRRSYVDVGREDVPTDGAEGAAASLNHSDVYLDETQTDPEELIPVILRLTGLEPSYLVRATLEHLSVPRQSDWTLIPTLQLT